MLNIYCRLGLMPLINFSSVDGVDLSAEARTLVNEIENKVQHFYACISKYLSMLCISFLQEHDEAIKLEAEKKVLWKFPGFYFTCSFILSGDGEPLWRRKKRRLSVVPILSF